MPKIFGIATDEECELIKSILQVEGMEVIAHRNLQNLVILFFSRKNEGKPDMMDMDQMSAITAVIDEEIIKRGGEAYWVRLRYFI